MLAIAKPPARGKRRPPPVGGDTVPPAPQPLPPGHAPPIFATGDKQEIVIDCANGYECVITTTGWEARRTSRGWVRPQDAEPWPGTWPAPDAPYPPLPDFRFAPRSAGLTREDMRRLYWTWIAAQYMRALIPRERPLVIASGPAGSGKTALLRWAGQLLLGPRFDALEIPRNDVRNTGTVMSKRAYVLLDNVESMSEDALDELARISTGRRLAMRRMYSDPDDPEAEVSVGADVFVGLSTFGGAALRADILTRSLVFRVEEGETYVGGREMMEMAAAYRPFFLRDLCHLSQQVLQRVDAGALATTGRSRLAEWESVAGIVADLWWPGDAWFPRVMAGMKTERLYALADTDELMGALVAWMQAGGAGREVTARDLLDGMAGVLDVAEGWTATVRSEDQLGRALARVRNRSSGLIHVSRRTVQGRSRYTFTFAPGIVVE